MVNKFLLSICIPTYMRCKNVEKLLENIIPICKELNIQICVSDNASLDDTELVCKKYSTEYSNLIYVKQSENTVSDNFYHAISISNGEYVWLLGDNDLPTAELIKKIYSFCESKKYGVVILHEYQNIYNKKLQKDSYIQVYENKEYQPDEYNDLLCELGCSMHLISNVVIEREAWNFSIDYYMFFKKYFPNSEHIGIEFKYIANCQKPSYFIYDTPLAITEVVNSKYPDDYKQIDNYKTIYGNIRRVRNWHDMFSNIERAFLNLQSFGYSYEAVTKALKIRENVDSRLSKTYSLFPLIHLKGTSYDDYLIMINDLHFIRWNIIKKINVFISKCIPRKFCKNLYNIYANLKKKK